MNKKMKKMLHSKKTKLVLTGAALVTMGLGTTYAWWTANTETSNTVTMGSLSIKADFPGLVDKTAFEPGLDVDSTGTIENTGSVEAFVQVKNDSQIQFALTADGTAIADADRKFEAVDPEAVQTDFTPVIDEKQTNAYWYNDPSGNLYCMMDPGSKVTVSAAENFDGEKCDNHYMGAVVKTRIATETAQAQTAPVQAQFNFDLGEITDYVSDHASDPDSADGVSFKTNDYHVRAMKHLHEMMDR